MRTIYLEFNQYQLILFHFSLLYFISKGGKIEVRLCGESVYSSATHCDTSHPTENCSDKLGNPKVDALTFSILRPTSMIQPFVKNLFNKNIGVIIGRCILKYKLKIFVKSISDVLSFLI